MKASLPCPGTFTCRLVGAVLLIVGLIGWMATEAMAQASVTDVDHQCGPGTGHIITYSVKATGSQPIYRVCFPRPRLQRGERPVLQTTGFACCETCCTEWSYAETVVGGRQVCCFSTTTAPIQPGETRTFTIKATLHQQVCAEGKRYRLDGGGLKGGNRWYFSTDPSGAAPPQLSSQTVSAINGSGLQVQQSCSTQALSGPTGIDTWAPDHMICDPPEFSAGSPTCGSIATYVMDDQDGTPQLICEELSEDRIRLTAMDESGNTTSSIYQFGGVDPDPTGIPDLTAIGVLILLVSMAGIAVVTLRGARLLG